MDIRKIYFYLVAFISLLIVLTSGASLTSLVLRQYVLQVTPEYSYSPPSPFDFLFGYSGGYYSRPLPIDEGRVLTPTQQEEAAQQLLESGELSGEQRAALQQWQQAFSVWQTEQENHQRQVVDRLIGSGTALLFFLPIFWYHFREAKKLR